MSNFIITYILPSSLAGWGGTFAFVVVILFAANIRSAFLKPLFLTMVMIKFHVSVENQSIDETWDSRLTSVSGKFRQCLEHCYVAQTGRALLRSKIYAAF